MKRKRGAKPHGEIRQSQVIMTFGPGAMLDLPNHSVLIAGLDFWSKGGEEIIEPSLDFHGRVLPLRAHANLAKSACFLLVPLMIAMT